MGSTYLRQFPLPSGDTVAVSVNFDSISEISSDNFLSSVYLMPVGRVVYEDLSQDERFLNQIESNHPLTHKDFYIDMQGRGELIEEEPYIKKRVDIIKTITAVITFPHLHWLGASVGVFPYIFMPRKLKKIKNNNRFD